MKTIKETGVALAMIIASAAAHAQDRSADPLQRITQCFRGGEFHAEGTYRLSESVVSRQVDTATGPMRVSIDDGYRMMIYRKSTAPIVNLLIERSAAGQFASDRDAIARHMAALAAGSQPPEKVDVENSALNGIDIIAINKPAMDTPGVISMVQLFDASTGTIATAHVLNQQGPAREFGSAAEYAVLRDRFIGALSACMARKS
jgi:hypothetical protein